MDLEIIKVASDDNNYKNLKNYTHYSKIKNSLCGDEMQIKLFIKDDKIINFGYQGKSCIYCKASANILSKISINNKKDEMNKLCENVKLYFNSELKNIKFKWPSLNKLFKKKNYTRKECILLPFEALKKIVSK